MNQKKPVQLSQKIDYLNQKISKIHTQIRKTQDLQLRLNFQQYIDNSIRQIIAIRDHTSSPSKNTNKQQQQQQRPYQNKYFTAQRQKLQYEKKIVNYQMKQLENKQFEIQYQNLKIRLFNKEKQCEKLEYEKNQLKLESSQEIKRLVDKNRFLQQEIEKISKLNKAQEEEIRVVKQQRNRAEKRQLQLQQKYDEDIGKLQKFSDKKPRYIDRNTQGLKCTVYYTNTSQSPKPGLPTNKILLLKLPTTIQVHKLMYGIILGIQANNKQILYYDKFQLYEKQITNIDIEHQSLILTYKRRKQNSRVVLDKYVVRVPEIVIMLYGKGDSVIVHDQVKYKEQRDR